MVSGRSCIVLSMGSWSNTGGGVGPRLDWDVRRPLWPKQQDSESGHEQWQTEPEMCAGIGVAAGESSAETDDVRGPVKGVERDHRDENRSVAVRCDRDEDEDGRHREIVEAEILDVAMVGSVIGPTGTRKELAGEERLAESPGELAERDEEKHGAKDVHAPRAIDDRREHDEPEGGSGAQDHRDRGRFTVLQREREERFPSDRRHGSLLAPLLDRGNPGIAHW